MKFPTLNILATSLNLIIFLLLFTSLQYSHAENEIYGTLKYGYQNSQKDKSYQPDIDLNYHSQKPDENSHNPSSKSRINNNDSHIGIKGKKEIGNGNAIIYQFEWGNEK